MRQDFYVYQHARKDTGAVFYAGKGRGKRAHNFNARSKYWKNVAKAAGGVNVQLVVAGIDEEFAFLVEQECIDVMRRRGIKLVNLTNGGDGTSGWVPSEETRRKIGEANKRTPKASGERHGMYGKKHTPESLAKMSASHKGKLTGEAHPFYGKRHSDETKAKISKNRKGKGLGVDNPFYGRKHTDEAKAKMAAPHIGRKQSEEERGRRSESALKYAETGKLSRPVLCVTNGVKYYGLNDAAKQLGLHRQSIRGVCNGKLKQTGGYIFIWSTK